MSQDDDRQRQRINLIVLAAVAVLVVVSVVLLVTLQHGIKQESCFAAGHRSCAPVEEQ
jgi:hypothetical protein